MKSADNLFDKHREHGLGCNGIAGTTDTLCSLCFCPMLLEGSANGSNQVSRSNFQRHFEDQRVIGKGRFEPTVFVQNPYLTGSWLTKQFVMLFFAPPLPKVVMGVDVSKISIELGIVAFTPIQAALTITFMPPQVFTPIVVD